MGKVTTYLSEEIRNILKTPPLGVSDAIAETAQRLKLVLDEEKKNLRRLLTEPEMGLIYEACSGAQWEAQRIGGSIMRLVSYAPFTLYEKYNVVKDSLLNKISQLSLGAEVALVDMLERKYFKDL